MQTDENNKRKKPRIEINPNLLRRGRSRGLVEEIGITSTPKSISGAKRVVTFSPKPQIIPILRPISEEINETVPHSSINTNRAVVASTSHQAAINHQNENQTVNDTDQTDNSSSNSDTNRDANLFKTAIDLQTDGDTSSSFDLDESANRFEHIVNNNPPFESIFARNLSFGNIPSHTDSLEDYYYLENLFNLSFGTKTEMTAKFKLSEIIPVIPSYDGKEEQLKLYIRSAKLYYNGVAETEKPSVLEILLSRLSGKAAESLGEFDEINTLDILIERLNDKIPETVSYTLAHTQLQRLVQLRNESINDYATRFEEALKKLKKATLQVGGGEEITEAIGKTLFI